MTSSDETVASVEEIVWHRAHPVYMLTALLRNLRGFLLPLVLVFLGRGGPGESPVVLGITALILLLSGIGGVVQWVVYRYALTPERLLVRSGIIFRQERAIPYARIQTVDLEEAPLDRLFGVARMKIETAAGGSAGSDVELNAVKRAAALALRERLLGARQRSVDSAAPGDAVPTTKPAGSSMRAADGELVRALSFRELLVAGATSGTIGPALAILGIGLRFAEEIVPDVWWSRVPWEEISGASPGPGVIAGLVGGVALVAWLLAIGATVLMWYGFELRHDASHLIVQYGLLDRRRTTIPIRRIQAIRIEEPLLRLPFRLATVRYDSAGRMGAEEGGSGLLFPMMPRRAVTALLREIAPEFARDVDRPPLVTLPMRSLSRYIVGKTVTALVVTVGVLVAIRFWQGGLPWWGYLPLAWPALEVLFGWLGWRDAGWWLHEGVLMLRGRGVERSTVIAPVRRIQHRETTANPLQRRGRLATLHIAVASGGLGGHYALRHMDAEAGRDLLRALKPSARSAARGIQSPSLPE